jgi:Domain of unknown function (DUF4160)
MPVVLRIRGYRLFFYSNEGNPREPPHVHAEAGDREAKFWLRPEVRVAYNDGFNSKTLRELLRLVEVNRERIETAWRNFFG